MFFYKIYFNFYFCFQFNLAGWLAGYTLGCQQVDYSSSPQAVRVSIVLRRIPFHMHSLTDLDKTKIQQNLCKAATLKMTGNGFSRPVGQKYCRMLQGEHSAILSTFIKLPFVTKIFVLSIFEWPFYTCFAVANLKLFFLFLNQNIC